jgi:toxin YoeB
VVSWEIVYAKQAMKDAKKLAASGLKPRAEELLAVLAGNPISKSTALRKIGR